MENYYIDTHMHATEGYNHVDDTQILIDRANQNQVGKMLLLSTSFADLEITRKITNSNPNVYLGIGIHPLDIKDIKDGEKLHQYMDTDVIAIGEIGLDYHYENSPSKEIQKQVFMDQLNIAQNYNLGVSIHAREAYDDVLEILSRDRYKSLKVSLHTYAGTLKQAEQFLKLENVYFGFSGIVTFKNAKEIQELCKAIPLNRILTETDTPFLTPSPHRGKPNEPMMLNYIVEKIAELKNISIEEVTNAVVINTRKVFNF
jgi:TatD DNase family protein